MKHKFSLALISSLLSTVALAAQTLDTMTVVSKRSTVPSFNTESVSKDEFYRQELIERGNGFEF